MLQLSSTTSDRSPYPAHTLVVYRLPLFLFLSVPRLLPDPLSVSRFSPRAKLLMNIGPKYQSTGIRRGFSSNGARRCICPYITGVYTPRFPPCGNFARRSPSRSLRLHGHARLSRVNSSSFLDHFVSLSLALSLFLIFSYSSFRSFLRALSRSLDGNSSLDAICPLSSCRSQGVPSPRARDIPPHENLIANPPETPANPSPRVDVDCPRAVRCSQARKRQQ